MCLHEFVKNHWKSCVIRKSTCCIIAVPTFFLPSTWCNTGWILICFCNRIRPLTIHPVSLQVVWRWWSISTGRSYSWCRWTSSSSWWLPATCAEGRKTPSTSENRREGEKGWLVFFFNVLSIVWSVWHRPLFPSLVFLSFFGERRNKLPNRVPNRHIHTSILKHPAPPAIQRLYCMRETLKIDGGIHSLTSRVPSVISKLEDLSQLTDCYFRMFRDCLSELPPSRGTPRCPEALRGAQGTGLSSRVKSGQRRLASQTSIQSILSMYTHREASLLVYRLTSLVETPALIRARGRGEERRGWGGGGGGVGIITLCLSRIQTSS